MKLPVDSDNDGWNVLHPALVLVQQGKKIQSWTVVDEFEDDHLPCVTIRIRIANKTFLLDDCWLSYRGVGSRFQAEKSQTVRARIIREWMSMWKDGQEENAEWAKQQAADIAALPKFKLAIGQTVKAKLNFFDSKWSGKPIRVLGFDKKKGTVVIGTANGKTKINVHGQEALKVIKKAKPPQNRVKFK